MASAAPGIGTPETCSTPSMSSRMHAMERESTSRTLDGGDHLAEVPAPPAPERIRVTRSVLLPVSEIEIRVSRSSGPGGQHAQKSSTRVEALLDVEVSTALSEVQKKRVVARAGSVLRAVAQDERSQSRNRELAIERLIGKLRDALAVPRQRVATRPGRAARERRLEAKRRRARTKALRRPPGQE
jgi:ribosome-associated protein